MIIFLDTGVLGYLCNPNPSKKSQECKKWLYQVMVRGARVVTSEICKYEVKRSLILVQMKNNSDSEGIKRLEELTNEIEFLPITGEAFDIAAEIWAESIIQWIPTAVEIDINVDIIICAQYRVLKRNNPGRYVVIATENVRHLNRFAEAHQFNDIKM